MKLLISVSIFWIGVQTVSQYAVVKEEWEAFKTRYNKIYDNGTEEKFRMKIFMENLYEVAEHNKRYVQGLVGYEAGINQFSDMLHKEFVQAMSCYRPRKKKNEDDRRKITFLPPANVQLPKEVDWRKKGYVTHVKNQTKYCQSCYAFSATGALEGQHFRKTGKLVSLSEQNIVDCSRKFDNYGCEGGNVDNAFEYIRVNRGVDLEKFYPYRYKEGPCHYDAKYRGAIDRGFIEITAGDEEALQSAVATVGPISTAIDATHKSFKHFRGKDVYYEPECSSKNVNHMVLIVGYGTYKGVDYWLVKNSWGTRWGDEGYIKMARNRKNHCGIASEALYPQV